LFMVRSSVGCTTRSFQKNSSTNSKKNKNSGAPAPSTSQTPIKKILMPTEWYVSFHGGEEKSSLNNIHVYSTDGKGLRKALNKQSLPKGVNLRELRGFVFGPDQNLYVVNAYFEYSEVLKFKGALNKEDQHDFLEVFVKRHPETNP